LNQKRARLQRKSNGSTYMLAAITACDFYTDPRSCCLWSVQSVTEWNCWCEKAKSQERTAVGPMLCD